MQKKVNCWWLNNRLMHTAHYSLIGGGVGNLINVRADRDFQFSLM
jgi:hypothetical protein